MRKHNAENERIKRKYLIFLKEAKRQNQASIDAVAMAISRFEKYTKVKNFKAFHFEQAVGFKKHLAKQTNQQTGKPLSKATLNSTLRHLKAFFQWLAMHVPATPKPTFNTTDSYYHRTLRAQAHTGHIETEDAPLVDNGLDQEPQADRT